VVGGVVLMRYGENPLAVTKRVKEKIQELQSGLPPGVRIVPAYDRTRLILGAVHTLTRAMWEEMLIAAGAVFLILWHVRSALVICVTLPLSVLFSFLLMSLLRALHIVDIQANIMSLAGITISIGILVDQAIVMVENATHHLKDEFADRPVTGDTRDIVIRACRTVGRPIFFSVLIMLLSFIPVFALSGREGKLFHPLAFTKSFALVGVALISVTVVPALIPTFIKGRLKREDENWIVRSFINIYKPVLTWALPRRNLVMWAFAVLLVLAAGIFPLQALIGQGASETGHRVAFLTVLALVTTLTVIFTRGAVWQAASGMSLLLLGLVAWHFTRIGVAFMPALDEGSTLDMPVTVPRAGITQAADDLKARDALLRGFPEVESVIGKVGRADTPTDPAPLDMVETFVNFRPRELWPRRVLRFEDAARQARAVLAALESSGFLQRVAAGREDERDNLIVTAAQKALERFDEVMRELAGRRYHEFERELGPVLTRFAVDEVIRRAGQAGALRWPAAVRPQDEASGLAERLAPDFGPALARHPAAEDVTRLAREAAERLHALGALADPAAGLALYEAPLAGLLSATAEALGAEPKTFTGEVLRVLIERRDQLWRERVKRLNGELFERGVEAYTWLALEELVKEAANLGLVAAAPQGEKSAAFAEAAVQAQRGHPSPGPGAAERQAQTHGAGTPGPAPQIQGPEGTAFAPFAALKDDLVKPFAARVLLWQRQSGPKGDLVDDEFGRVLQVPGWSNIFTQPIINRIEMLSTGVRTDIGVKVFGPDLDTINRVCKDIEAALKPLNGARDVVAAQVMGKGYLEINVDLERAGRHGVRVEDLKDTIEVALGGQAVTQTVEGRDRFPVRLRYPRSQREDEDTVRRLLVSGTGTGNGAMGAATARMTEDSVVPSGPPEPAAHQAAPGHGTRVRRPLQVPLGEVADVRVVEGPAMLKSENGRLVNYVTLNVRGRDVVGFVEEAQRVVGQKVRLPEGVHVEWSGEFEHQVRAAKTLRFVFPAVILLIFVILYLTYRDLADAGLMMLAVPEALAGGAFFQFLFPKLVHGWSAPPLEFSVAVWVGYIACFGMATETGIIMLVYLREAIDRRGGLEKIRSLAELRQAVLEGAVHRLRPKLLTEGVAILALAPMLWATGVGAEVIAPMALPVLGGLLISDEVVDIFLPVRFYWVRRARWLALHGKDESTAETEDAALPPTEPAPAPGQI
jgi:Cu(I)/Ag(I) efflux system membrane protein CusA/SilA